MVARSQVADSPDKDYPDAPLPEDILAEVAEMRVRCRPWSEIADALGWEVGELRRALRHDPNYPAALELALREAEVEAEAEMLVTLRGEMRSDDPAERVEAAAILSKHLTARNRDRTRLEVERMKSEVALARVRAKGAAKPEEEGEQEVEYTEAQLKHLRECRERADRYYAEKVARGEAVVYLWGGCHKLGDVLPDDTDTPLHISADHTHRGNVFYWATTAPLPVADAVNGPFLAPPGCRPRTCPTHPNEPAPADDAPPG